MGSLRDELKKAGLLNDKDIRRVHQDEQQRKKDLGKEGVAEEERRQRNEAAERAKAQAAKDRDLSRQRESERERKEAQARTRLGIHNAILKDIGGPRRFHFITRQQTIVFLEVAPEIARRLEAGELAIINRPSEASGDFAGDDYAVVPRETARTVRELAPEAVRFWNGG